MQDETTPGRQPAASAHYEGDQGRKPCSEECGSYGSGHAMHPIRARHTGEQPWGWRDAIVESVHGLRATVRYLDGDSAAPRVWHHHDLAAWVAPGDLVRLHELCRVLGTARGWVAVQIDDGLGPVAGPAEPDLWAAERSPGIVDLASGAALPTDRLTN